MSDEPAFWIGCVLVSLVTFIGLWTVYERVKRLLGRD